MMRRKAKSDISENAAQPLMPEMVTIMVNGKPVLIRKDELEKQLYLPLYEHLGVNLDFGA